MVLGTVQLGMDYGVTNSHGRPDKRLALLILERAWQLGIRSFDTAEAYGTEALICEFIKAHGIGDEINILTKISSLRNQQNPVERLMEKIESSSSQLGSEISTLFLHDPNDVDVLMKHEEKIHSLIQNYPSGLVGISIYDPPIAESLSLTSQLSVQFPYNLLDNRFSQITGFAKCFARSIFFQGILAGGNELRGGTPRGLIAFHQKYHAQMKRLGLDPVGLALNFVLSQQKIDGILFGVQRVEELEHIMSVDLPGESEVRGILEDLDLEIEPSLLDPRNWNN